MGFTFRKSISFGGTKINLSKSGVSVSGGVRGLRLVKRLYGNKPTTLYAGTHGMRYIKRIPNSANKKDSLDTIEHIDGTHSEFASKQEDSGRVVNWKIILYCFAILLLLIAAAFAIWNRNNFWCCCLPAILLAILLVYTFEFAKKK